MPGKSGPPGADQVIEVLDLTQDDETDSVSGDKQPATVERATLARDVS